MLAKRARALLFVAALVSFALSASLRIGERISPVAQSSTKGTA
jgi:Cu/Ag efflux protein CusF